MYILVYISYKVLQHGATETIQNTRRKTDGHLDLSNEILSKVSTSFGSLKDSEAYAGYCSIAAIERKLGLSLRKNETKGRGLTSWKGLLCMLGLLATNYRSKLTHLHRSTSMAPPCVSENQTDRDTSALVLYVLAPLLCSVY